MRALCSDLKRSTCLVSIVSLVGLASAAVACSSSGGDTNAIGDDTSSDAGANARSDSGSSGDDGDAASGDDTGAITTDAGSDAASDDGGAPGDGSTGTSDGGVVNAGTFKTGDPFDYGKVTLTSQMVSTELTALGYATSTAAKAIAINGDGLGFVAVYQGQAAADAQTEALEGCFVEGGGKPCAILAKGDTFAEDGATFGNALLFTLATPTDMASIPFVNVAIRASVASQFQALATPRALAIAADGTYEFVGSTTSEPLADDTEAERVAMERCEMSALLSPCTVFAVDSTIMFNPTAANFTPAIDYSSTTLGATIPGMTAHDFSSFSSSYNMAILNGLHGAIYIADNGAWSYVTNSSATTADTNARSSCNSGADGATCFKYAADRALAFTAADDQAQIQQPSIACQATPRLDCAAHEAMGCSTSGMFYTTHSGGVTLESCTF